MSTHQKRILFLIVSITLISCKNYYNETIYWCDTIEYDTSIDSVKKSQPKFIEIDWDNPQDFGNTKAYLITKIKRNYDPLEMSHYLTFSDGKFRGRISQK